MKGPTPRQVEVLRTIKRATLAKGYPPTLREVGAILAIASTNGVNDHLKRLRAKGLLEEPTDVAQSRGLRLTAKGDETAGDLKVSADGPPVVDVPVFTCLDPANVTRCDERPLLRMSRHLLNGSRDPFGLALYGEPMDLRRFGCVNGDVVIADSRSDIVGKVVLFLRDGKVSLRRYLWHGIEQRYEFQAVVSGDPPIFVEPSALDSSMILGTVIALWRTTT